VSAPTVSVVIPTRNRRQMLARTLRTVLVQRDTDLEVLVVDEGSTDGTVDLLRELGDPRVRVLRNEAPQGVAAARNRGLLEAAGTWVALLDDDDLWSPDKLRGQLDAADRAGAAWAYAGAVAVDDALAVVRAYPSPAPAEVRDGLPLRNMVPAGASNVVLRRDLLDEVGRFDEALRHMADWDLWIRLGRAGAPAHDPRPLVAYRIHGGNASLDTPEILGEGRVIEQRYGTPIDWATVHWWVADSSLRGGRRLAAARQYALAARAGQPRNWARAVNALVRPAPVGRIDHNPLRRAPEHAAWAAEAEAWLDPLRRSGPPG
jgi:glycosyltransferase involved in cell wall biosynthesis